jgi:hypothetical protein
MITNHARALVQIKQLHLMAITQIDIRLESDRTAMTASVVGF